MTDQRGREAGVRVQCIAHADDRVHRSSRRSIGYSQRVTRAVVPRPPRQEGNMYFKHVTLALLSTMSGCTLSTDASDASVARMCLPVSQVKAPALAATPCPILNCGDNAPNAGDNLLFDELDLFGRSNHAGVSLFGPASSVSSGRILSATWLDLRGVGHPAWVDIERDKLIVHDEMTGSAYEGRDLIGTVIQLIHKTGEIFELRVACYEDRVQQFLASPSEFVRVYDFQARRQPLVQGNTNWFEVCNRDPLLPDPGWTGMPYHALLYRGDRYTRQKQVVPNDPANGWSFIGCNGSAGSKMHLHRHTYAGGIDAMGVEIPEATTSLEKRTTLLKAITADYCGDGRSDFTELGHPLAFATARDPGWFSMVWTSGVTSFEAIWGPAGAVCLDTPRLATSLWPRARVESLAGCNRWFYTCGPGMTMLPGGTTPPSGWDSRGYVITGNP